MTFAPSWPAREAVIQPDPPVLAGTRPAIHATPRPVIAGLVPAIHATPAVVQMAGTRPAMTSRGSDCTPEVRP